MRADEARFIALEKQKESRIDSIMDTIISNAKNGHLTLNYVELNEGEINKLKSLGYEIRRTGIGFHIISW